MDRSAAVRRFFLLVVMACLWAAAMTAHAAFPASGGTTKAEYSVDWFRSSSDHGAPHFFDTPQGACTDYAALWRFWYPNGMYVNSTVIGTPQTPTLPNMNIVGTCNVVFRISSSNPEGQETVNIGGRLVTQPYSCPANSTLSGNQCTCTAPYVQNATNNGCTTPEQNLCDALKGHTEWMSTPGVPSLGQTQCTAAGCQVQWSVTVSNYKNRVTGVSDTEGIVEYTGATCTYDPNAPQTSASPDQCKGGYYGQVGGVWTCVPHSTQDTTVTTTKKTDSTASGAATPASGGASAPTGTTATSGTETTKCEGEACTTTKTTETTNPDGSKTTTTETKKTTMSDYCKENPREAICQATQTGSFGGTCQTNFTCTGDAVHCATAKATNDAACSVDPGNGTAGVEGELKAGTFGPSLVKLEKNVGQFDQSNPMGGACPGNYSFTVAGMSMTIPLASACNELQMMGNALVAFTLLAATIFVIKGIGG